MKPTSPMGRLIEDAIKRSGKAQAEVARNLGVTPQAITGWIRSGKITKDNLVGLARETNTDVSVFLGNGKGNVESNVSQSYTKIPLISWVQAGKKNPASDPYQPGASEDWEETSVPLSPGMFALRVRGDSMVAPDGTGFPEGCVIVVDPSIQAKNGDHVVVRFEDSDEVTFKRLVVDGPLKLLKPLNPSYPVITVTDDARLCGVVVEFINRRRFR